MLSASRFPSIFKQLVLTAAGSLALLSCTDDKVASPLYNLTKDGSNVFVMNEGNFGTPNGALSYFSKTSRSVVDKNIFQTVNGRELGDVVQSMAVIGNQGYIVANNSQKLEVVDLRTFQTVATITGLAQPRYVLMVANNKAYVSEWVSFGQAGRIAVIDLATNTITKTIPVGPQPEQLLLANSKVYVGSTGDDLIRVINPATDAVESTIKVKDAPGSLVLDKSGAIWALCSGITTYDSSPPYNVLTETSGNLVKFAPAAPTTQTVLPFKGHPNGLRLNGTGDQLYYRAPGGVFRMGVADAALPAKPLISRSLYGFDVDPADNTLYGSIAPFTTTGKFIRYKTDGVAIDSFDVNIGPNSFVFY